MDKILVEYNSPNGIFFQHRVLEKEFDEKPTSSAQYEFLYLVKGRLELRIKEQIRQMTAGELALIDANVLHSVTLQGGTQAELMTVSALPSVLPSVVNFGFMRIVADSALLAYCLPESAVSKFKIYDCFKRLSAMAQKPDAQYKDVFISAEITHMVGVINQAIDSLTRLRSASIAKMNKTGIVSKCLDFINSNIHKKLGVDEISETLRCSKSYLQHVFKKAMGLTISEYINVQKMAIAKALLASGVIPSDVADKLGYEYYSTFSSKFKKFYKVAPKDVQIEKAKLELALEIDEKEN